MAHLYKRYLRLLEKWPVDPSKTPDLGQHIRNQIKINFPKGERSSVTDEKECLKNLECLERIASNVYKNKYPANNLEKTSIGLNLEQINLLLSEEGQKVIQEQKKGRFLKLRNTFQKYFGKKVEEEKKE